jgi:hypothetical protein
VLGYHPILRTDLNAEDDEGRWWTLLRDAADPARIKPGAVLVAGTERFWSVVRIERVDDDGQVHFVACLRTILTHSSCSHEQPRA